MLLHTACTKPEANNLPPKEVVLTKTTLRISTALPTELPLGPGNAPAGCPPTKSSSQMQPEDLNMIKTLSVFQYDPEGNLAVTDYHDYTEGGRYDGVLSTILNVNLAIYDETTVCLVANLYESEFNSIVSACPLLRDFQDYKATIPYVGLSADNLGLGTTERIYMSGYYEGDIRQGQEISVTLGRLVSNIAIGIAASDAYFTPLTCIGGVIGIGLSILLLMAGKSYLLAGAEYGDIALTFPMLIRPGLFVATLLAVLVLNLLSAGIPAWLTMRQPIVEAIKGGE